MARVRRRPAVPGNHRRIAHRRGYGYGHREERGRSSADEALVQGFAVPEDDAVRVYSLAKGTWRKARKERNAEAEHRRHTFYGLHRQVANACDLQCQGLAEEEQAGAIRKVTFTGRSYHG